MKIKIDKSLHYKQLNKKNTKSKSIQLDKLFFLLLIIILIITEKILLIINKENKANNIRRKINKDKKEYKDYKYIQNQKNYESNNITYEFNQKINEIYINAQKNFCTFFSSFYNKKYEDLIQLSNVSFNGNYQMYVYKHRDIISSNIKLKKNWESIETNHLLSILNYYSKKKKIKKEDIYILDIGTNIGWHSITLGRHGYKIIGFEPSGINYYILKKNYCLNKGINVTFINKGLNTEEKICDLYNLKNNEGNGMVICDKNTTLPNFLKKNKRGEIILTKLSNYIPFLLDKNLALIKLDVEGFEGKVIEGGIEL